jgi:hypothetical protein
LVFLIGSISWFLHWLASNLLDANHPLMFIDAFIP